MVQVGGGTLQLKPSLETEWSCGSASQVKPPKLRISKWQRSWQGGMNSELADSSETRALLSWAGLSDLQLRIFKS